MMTSPQDSENTFSVGIDFLLSFYDPWYTLGIFRSETFKRVRRAAPCGHVDEEHRTKEYHFGRIRAFVELLCNGRETDPIELGRDAQNRLIVTDGNHRLIAAFLVGRKAVKVRNPDLLRLVS